MIQNIFQIIFLLSSITGYSQEYPVSFSLEKEKTVQIAQLFILSVSFNAQPSWYIYAPTGANTSQGMIETNIIFQLPKGITKKGKIQLPKTKLKGGFEVYDGKNIEFKQQFAVDKNMPPGEYIIKAKITYQSCNDKICLPPKADEEEIKIIIVEK